VSNKCGDCLSFSGGRLAEEISTDFRLFSSRQTIKVYSSGFASPYRPSGVPNLPCKVEHYALCLCEEMSASLCGIKATAEGIQAVLFLRDKEYVTP